MAILAQALQPCLWSFCVLLFAMDPLGHCQMRQYLSFTSVFWYPEGANFYWRECHPDKPAVVAINVPRLGIVSSLSCSGKQFDTWRPAFIFQLKEGQGKVFTIYKSKGWNYDSSHSSLEGNSQWLWHKNMFITAIHTWDLWICKWFMLQGLSASWASPRT